jgi:hypothetical protein
MCTQNHGELAAGPFWQRVIAVFTISAIVYKFGFPGNGGPQTLWTKNKLGFEIVKDTMKQALRGLF